jgi:hypothetical protein
MTAHEQNFRNPLLSKLGEVLDLIHIPFPVGWPRVDPKKCRHRIGYILYRNLSAQPHELKAASYKSSNSAGSILPHEKKHGMCDASQHDRELVPHWGQGRSLNDGMVSSHKDC